MNDYYVYEHIRLDNNTCFYVGKGRGKRYKNKSRNSHHDRIVEKYGMKSVIVKDGLSEQDAFDYEQKLIHHYVFDLGYGIDIKGYRKTYGNMLTNQTLGGDGNNGAVHTKEWCKQHSKDMMGKNNPMYGVNLWDTYSDEQKHFLKENLSKHNSGENNPMYGISPKERMSDSQYKIWLQKKSENSKGKNNPNYGNDTLYKKLEANPELRMQYYSRPGVQNGRATKVHLYKDGEFIKTFDYISLCAKWIKETLQLNSKINTIQSAISTSVKTNKPYHDFMFIYEK